MNVLEISERYTKHWQRLHTHTASKFIIIWSVFWFFVYIPLSDFLCSIIFLLVFGVFFLPDHVHVCRLNTTYLEDIINNFERFCATLFHFVVIYFDWMVLITWHKNDRHIHIPKFSLNSLFRLIDFRLMNELFSGLLFFISNSQLPFSVPICISNVVDLGVEWNWCAILRC